MIDLDGRVALVTGGGRGIGRAIAQVLARQGASVAVGDIDGDAAQAVARKLQAQGFPSLGLLMDVTARESVETAVDLVVKGLGPVDILAANAGVLGAAGWRSGSRDEDWDFTFAVNLRGAVISSEAVLPSMIERGMGKIVITASAAGRLARPNYPHYSASKAAVINYTKSLATQVAPHSINVNAVCPGPLATEMFRSIALYRSQNIDADRGLSMEEIYRRDIEARVPMNREITPEDVANMVAFLASEEARNITGQAIHVDGGQVMV